MVINSEKKILLDYETAPKPPFIQLLTGVSGEQTLTFFNPYKNAIYFYDYEKAIYTGKIEYEREGPHGILRFGGYYIKNMDSIYVYNGGGVVELALTDSKGEVKQRISLIDNISDNSWVMYYPQYLLSTVNPLTEAQGKLVLTGMSPFSIADSLIQKFLITACIDMQSCEVEFMHTYPNKLYGFNTNWQDPMFMQGYREFSLSGEWIYSFPVSHDVYTTQWGDGNYKTFYAGSNTAGTISSIDDGRERTPNELILTHILQQDLYTAILYDPYRNVYYRFMLQGIPNVSIKNRLNEKPIVVIIMDERFNYLGETVIGTGEKWNWSNSFVTPDGLAIEYFDPEIDSEEEYLTQGKRILFYF